MKFTGKDGKRTESGRCRPCSGGFFGERRAVREAFLPDRNAYSAPDILCTSPFSPALPAAGGFIIARGAEWHFPAHPPRGLCRFFARPFCKKAVIPLAPQRPFCRLDIFLCIPRTSAPVLCRPRTIARPLLPKPSARGSAPARLLQRPAASAAGTGGAADAVSVLLHPLCGANYAARPF